MKDAQHLTLPREGTGASAPGSGAPRRTLRGGLRTAEVVMQGIFLVCGLIAVAFVLLISIYLIISGIPAIREVGLFNFLFGDTWSARDDQYGILAMILIPGWEAVHWAQIFVQQLVCFSCLGYAGISGGSQKQKLLLGVILAVFLKFTGHVLSGVVFFSQNAWDGWGAWAYSLTYHLTSKVPEGIATGAVLLALPVTLFKKVGKAGACA